MAIFEVKKGIPIADPREIYPFDDMEEGDCFDAPDDMGFVRGTTSKSARRHSILASARNWKARRGVDALFQTALMESDAGEPIVRCWLVALQGRVDDGEAREERGHD